MVQFSGKSGATIESLKRTQLSDVRDFELEIVILDIGTNDLSTCSPGQLASAIAALVETLLTDYQVQFVVVVQILPRFKSMYPSSRPIDIPKFNADVDSCNKLLVEKLSNQSKCKFWWHKGFWGHNQRVMFGPDGVHFSSPKGQSKYFHNLRAILVSYIKKKNTCRHW